MKLLVTGGSGFIGVNAIEYFADQKWSVLNVDVRSPINPKLEQIPLRKIDILDRAGLIEAFRDFQPELVLHLAARTDCDEKTTVEEGYRANTEGTANVLAAIKAAGTVQRCIITSSQFVCRPGYRPQNDGDYNPETVYGASKAISETLTREAKLECIWTIIRPTNIWGPWHLRYRTQVWRTLRKGFYLHPGGAPVVRTYGYVGNVVRQIDRIFRLPAESVDGRTIYVGDPPVNLIEWVNAFSRALRGREVNVIPRPLLQGLAAIGDGISAITGREFLLTSSRYRSMTTDYVTLVEESLALLGEDSRPFALSEGVDETVRWLKHYHPGDNLKF